MRISDLTAYAADKYNIHEEFKWADFPGFSVLCDPKSGKWVALLMRHWDSETGTELESCDLKCGNEVLFQNRKPYLSKAVRMHGGKWVNIAFDDSTEEDAVYKLFDKAVTPDVGFGHTIVLGSQFSAGESRYQDTALPFDRPQSRPGREKQPERLRNMRRLFGYGRGGSKSKAENFYQQAAYLRDYEDDLPWSGDFTCYFPTYDEMTTRQLRGYFGWRTRLRKGEYGRIPSSAAYLYIYELLNGIGADSPEDSLKKMKDFETGYIDSIAGDKRMRTNLHRWMLDFAVLKGLPAETATKIVESELIARDNALSVLRNADRHSDEEVFESLLFFGPKKTAASPVFSRDPEEGRHLFSQVWRQASAYRENDKDLFTLCFGTPKRRQWYPLSNAIYYDSSEPKDREYVLDDSRRFFCENGIWYIEAYENLYYDRERFQGFLHETDARIRRYLKTGRYLQEKKENKWTIPFIDAVIEADKKEKIEAARPKITIDLSDLDRIRRDAVVTRDSLLTEEDLAEFENRGASSDTVKQNEQDEQTEYLKETAVSDSFRNFSLGPEPIPSDSSLEKDRSEECSTDLPLDSVQIEILRVLLKGEDAADIIKANHLMPSITADFINEALFDEFGDSVLVCEDDRLFLVEDYIEDLEDLLGGHSDG